MMKMNSASRLAALVSNYLAGVLKNDMTVTVGQGRNVAAIGESRWRVS